MRPARTAVVASLVAPLLLAAPAYAHGGHTPFANCGEAYANGHASIPASSPHYRPALDRDGDGIGCDNPPAGFVPASEESAPAGAKPSASPSVSVSPAPSEESGLAETGGSSATPYVVAGAAVLLIGGVLLLLRRRS